MLCSICIVPCMFTPFNEINWSDCLKEQTTNRYFEFGGCLLGGSLQPKIAVLVVLTADTSLILEPIGDRRNMGTSN